MCKERARLWQPACDVEDVMLTILGAVNIPLLMQVWKYHSGKGTFSQHCSQINKLEAPRCPTSGFILRPLTIEARGSGDDLLIAKLGSVVAKELDHISAFCQTPPSHSPLRFILTGRIHLQICTESLNETLPSASAWPLLRLDGPGKRTVPVTRRAGSFASTRQMCRNSLLGLRAAMPIQLDVMLLRPT